MSLQNSFRNKVALSGVAVEYTDCFSAKVKDPQQRVS